MKSAIQKKSFPPKKLSKTDREQGVLFGLIELYLKLGKPIGSQTLQENGFESLSSATIRNYFAKMESSGYLKQPHTSGGRIPTAQGFRLYAEHYLRDGELEKNQEELLEKVFKENSREIATMLNRSADTLSELTKCAVFVSAPRFDQDFIQDVRLIRVGNEKILIVLITDFGLVRSETFYLEKEVSPHFLRTAEEYFLWRMNKGEKPLFGTETEAKLAQKLYNEAMVRHVVGYANFPEEDILRTGLSKLLSYPEFSDAVALASSLSLLEDPNQMRALLRKCCKKGELSVWVGDELVPFIPERAECTVIAIPYRINQIITGAIAILGPMRVPYRNLFGLMQIFSENLNRALTEKIYKFKITFRQASIPIGFQESVIGVK